MYICIGSICNNRMSFGRIVCVGHGSRVVAKSLLNAHKRIANLKQKLKCYPYFIGRDIKCDFSLLNANGLGVNIYKFTTYYTKYIIIIMYIRYNLKSGREGEREREIYRKSNNTLILGI